MSSSNKTLNYFTLVIQDWSLKQYFWIHLCSSSSYSSAVLYLRAEDPGFTTENYSNEMLKTNTTTPENEAKRIAFIQFLYSAKNAAYHIADVAEAESFGDYQNALSCLQTAKGDLRNIEVNAALPPTNSYNVRINHR